MKSVGKLLRDCPNYQVSIRLWNNCQQSTFNEQSLLNIHLIHLISLSPWTYQQQFKRSGRIRFIFSLKLDTNCKYHQYFTHYDKYNTYLLQFASCKLNRLQKSNSGKSKIGKNTCKSVGPATLLSWILLPMSDVILL